MASPSDTTNNTPPERNQETVTKSEYEKAFDEMARFLFEQYKKRQLSDPQSHKIDEYL